MCKLCEEKPVYEFTNKRKLCSRCFVDYFEKKILYSAKKFNMIKRGDIVGLKKDDSFKSVVLEDILEFLQNKIYFQIVKIPNKKANKTAVYSCLDSEAESMLNILIKGKISNLKGILPENNKIVKPFYLFLEQEIRLYAKIKRLKFKKEKDDKDKIGKFADEFEKKHPEVKRAVINSLLELYKE